MTVHLLSPIRLAATNPHPPIRLRCASPDGPFPAAAQRSQEFAPLPAKRRARGEGKTPSIRIRHFQNFLPHQRAASFDLRVNKAHAVVGFVD